MLIIINYNSLKVQELRDC